MSRVHVGEAITVEIPAEVLSQLESLQGLGHHLIYQFSPWQDAVLQRFWPRGANAVPRKDIVRLLARDGKPPSEGTVRRRARELGIED